MPKPNQIDSMPRPNTSAHTLHIVVGPPAAGKTTYGRELARKLGAAFLDIDTCTETIVRAAQQTLGEDPDDRDSPTFKDRFREPIYQSLFAIAKANLLHIDAVITGPFTKEFANPNWLSELRQTLGMPGDIKAYYLQAHAKTRYERMLRRANPRDRRKLENWESFLRYYGEDTPPLFPHTVIEM